MATGGVPNAVYVIQAIMAELGEIGPANGNNTNIKTVQMPGYQPFDKDGDLTMDVIAVQTPALLLWLDTAGENMRRGHLGGNLAGTISLIIMGLMSQPDGLQFALLALAEDVRGVMRSNLARKYPGSTADGLAIDTVLDMDFNFGVRQGSQSKSIGTFVSRWKVEYRFQPPKG